MDGLLSMHRSSLFLVVSLTSGFMVCPEVRETGPISLCVSQPCAGANGYKELIYVQYSEFLPDKLRNIRTRLFCVLDRSICAVECVETLPHNSN